MSKKKRYLWECPGCGKVFTCRGDCETGDAGLPCHCNECLMPWKKCFAREIKSKKLVMLAKLNYGKGIWIDTKKVR